MCACSVMSDSATSWIAVHQTPLSMEFSGKNTGVGCYSLLKGIFLTQGFNPLLLHLLHWQVDSLPMSTWKIKLYLSIVQMLRINQERP